MKNDESYVAGLPFESIYRDVPEIAIIADSGSLYSPIFDLDTFRAA